MQYYNPMEMPTTQQRTEEECSGLACANEENNTSGSGGWLSGAGSALTGLADVLGVFYGGNNQPPVNGTTTVQPNTQPQSNQNNTIIIIIVVLVLLLLVGLGIFLAVRASKKK